MQDVILSTLVPSTTCTIDHNNGVHAQLLTTYTCINNQWWVWMDVNSSLLIDKYRTPITLTFNTFKIWAWICSPISHPKALFRCFLGNFLDFINWNKSYKTSYSSMGLPFCKTWKREANWITLHQFSPTTTLLNC